ncbi:GNAT family N-acetyltransferase [Paenibacillus pinihumi]|uniref:GNAT family N-acetyltransferase n=1 Tax=Paenibacillus pinihumi TaxID=669462 RepID=UPI0003FA90F9|nr:GNAT family N-acetyltransferase [Paenibacillus pinihumi]
MITLREINKHNWETCIQLQVEPGQEAYIASNLYSIAQAQFLDGFVTKGIYKEDQMIGFAMYGLDADDGNYWVYRFMIDRRFQKQGFGQLAMQQVIEDIRSKADRTDVILLGYDPGNRQARALYAKAGFIEEEIAPWGEQVARYRFTL